MTAIILGWNPDRWNAWAYDAMVDQVIETGQARERWNVGARLTIEPGVEAWLLLQGRAGHSSGLIGHGIVTSETYAAGQLTDPSKMQQYVTVVFDALLPVGSQVPPDVLAEAVPGVPWNSFQGSGTSVSGAEEESLRRLWRQLGPKNNSDPVSLTPGTYPGHSVTRVEVNRWERSPEARRACLAFHGSTCAACGFSYEVQFGAVGRDFMHVHHVVPASLLGPGYQLDPITDLVPLCANCHNVAHLGVVTARSVTELRELIAAAGHLPGQLMNQAAMDAQDDAERILGQQ